MSYRYCDRPSNSHKSSLEGGKRFKFHPFRKQHSDLAREEFAGVQGLTGTHWEWLQFKPSHLMGSPQEFLDP